MHTKQKSSKKPFLALAALLVVIAALFGVYQFSKGTAVQGEKTITVEVVHKDGSLHDFTYQIGRAHV